jgi:hypothetical protein
MPIITNTHYSDFFQDSRDIDANNFTLPTVFERVDVEPEDFTSDPTDIYYIIDGTNISNIFTSYQQAAAAKAKTCGILREADIYELLALQKKNVLLIKPGQPSELLRMQHIGEKTLGLIDIANIDELLNVINSYNNCRASTDSNLKEMCARGDDTPELKKIMNEGRKDRTRSCLVVFNHQLYNKVFSLLSHALL